MADIDPKFKPLTDGAKNNAVIPISKKPKHEQEQAWLLEVEDWQALFKALPADDKKRLPPKELPIGGDDGWLTLAARPAITKAFKCARSLKVSTPDAGKNCHGIFTYGSNVCLWRNCTHDNHNPEGGGPSLGKTFDAFEAYRLLPVVVAKAGFK
jgi:hypothetical protein